MISHLLGGMREEQHGEGSRVVSGADGRTLREAAASARGRRRGAILAEARCSVGTLPWPCIQLAALDTQLAWSNAASLLGSCSVAHGSRDGSAGDSAPVVVTHRLCVASDNHQQPVVPWVCLDDGTLWKASGTGCR